MAFPHETMSTGREPEDGEDSTIDVCILSASQEVCAAGAIQQPAEAVERPLAATPRLPVGAAELRAPGGADRRTLLLFRQGGANHGPCQPQRVIRILSHQHGEYNK